MAKTADYTIKAIANYQKTKERVTILFDRGTKDALIKKHGARPISTIIKEIIDADLNENITGSPAPKKTTAKKQKPEPEPITDDPANDPALIFENYNENK